MWLSQYLNRTETNKSIAIKRFHSKEISLYSYWIFQLGKRINAIFNILSNDLYTEREKANLNPPAIKDKSTKSARLFAKAPWSQTHRQINQLLHTFDIWHWPLILTQTFDLDPDLWPWPYSNLHKVNGNTQTDTQIDRNTDMKIPGGVV